MFLTNVQWSLVRPLLPPYPASGRRGRPALDPRRILNGILWKLSSGSAWARIPPACGSWQVCFLHYRRWKQDGTLRRVIDLLLRDVRQRGGFDYVQAVRAGTVKLILKGDRYEVFLPASLFYSWQLATSLLFYQRLATLMARKLGLPRHFDPLSELYATRRS